MNEPTLIAGGGIGGLAAALGLARQGQDVLVLERRRSWARSAPASSSAPTPSTASTTSASATPRAAWPCSSTSCA